MIAGISLEQLGSTILTQQAQKRDFVVPTTQLALVTPDSKPSLAFTVDGVPTSAHLTHHALRQIGIWADIPAPYLDRLALEKKPFSSVKTSTIGSRIRRKNAWFVCWITETQRPLVPL